MTTLAEWSWLRALSLACQVVGSSRNATKDSSCTGANALKLRRAGVGRLFQKKCEEWKGFLTPAGLLKLVKRFEETGKLEDRARAGRPCLKEARAPCIAVEMEAIASEAASGTSSAREAARRLGLPPSSVLNILR
ncbi:hypothetical protein TNCV_4827901 [Trichonephila clavipes]|uniref:Uncharacterized protein n=1 Tax=Trichonephila clavipes TaxID=2585209 RepID=A0A8X6SUB8_TRICX|nr:hypothetical protein TNCV_4827901 [Trichonephila clavipes]